MGESYESYYDDPYDDNFNASYYDDDTDGPKMPVNAEEDFALRGVWVSMGWSIIACGTVGHLMTMLVLLSSRRMRAQPLTVHLIALSLAGLASLYFGLLREVVFAGSTDSDGNNMDLRKQTSESGCKFHVMFTYVSLQLYSWLQATIATDRLASICWPIKYRKLCTHRANVLCVVVQLIILTGCNAFVAHIIGNVKGEKCGVTDAQMFGMWEYVDLVIFSALPAAIMMPTNIATLALIRTRLQTKLHVRRSWPVTAMLLTINAVFIVTTLPISIMHFVYSTTTIPTAMWLRAAFSLFQYAGSASSFLFYCVAGSNFRKSVADVFRCKNGSKQSSLSVRSSVLKTDSQEGQSRFAMASSCL